MPQFLKQLADIWKILHLSPGRDTAYFKVFLGFSYPSYAIAGLPPWNMLQPTITK